MTGGASISVRTATGSSYFLSFLSFFDFLSFFESLFLAIVVITSFSNVVLPSQPHVDADVNHTLTVGASPLFCEHGE